MSSRGVAFSPSDYLLFPHLSLWSLRMSHRGESNALENRSTTHSYGGRGRARFISLHKCQWHFASAETWKFMYEASKSLAVGNVQSFISARKSQIWMRKWNFRELRQISLTKWPRQRPKNQQEILFFSWWKLPRVELMTKLIYFSLDFPTLKTGSSVCHWKENKRTKGRIKKGKRKLSRKIKHANSFHISRVFSFSLIITSTLT